MPTTRTITRTDTRQRALSLSLVAPSPPSALLLTLPSELILDILELAVLAHRTTALALARVCAALTPFADALLYRAVVLPTPRSVALFARTARIKPSFLAENVHTLAVTADLPTFGAITDALTQQFRVIFAACTGVRTLALPAALAPLLPFVSTFHSPASSLATSTATSASASASTLSPAPCSLTLSTFPTQPLPALPGLAKIRFAEPGDLWHAPCAALGPAASVSSTTTHVHLARRAHANEENDAVFVADLRALLARTPGLRTVVVSVFPQGRGLGWDTGVRDSAVWALLEEVRAEDTRVVLREGRYGEWAREWQGGSPVVKAEVCPLDFWERARRGDVEAKVEDETDDESDGEDV